MVRFRKGGAETGASSLEFAVLFAVLLVAILGLFHFSFTFAASEAVDDAAQEALEAASKANGTSADGQDAAAFVLDREPSVESWTIRVQRGAAETTVVVSGRSNQILPGLPTEVGRTVVGPTERFISEADR